MTDQVFVFVIAVTISFAAGMAVSELRARRRRRRRRQVRINEFGNFEPIGRAVDPMKRPPFHIGTSVGEKR